MSLLGDNSFLLTLALGFVLFYWFFIWESKVVTFLKSFPGPKLYPIFGNAWAVRRPETFFGQIEEWSRMYKPRFRIFLGSNFRFVILTEPKDVEKILTSSVVIDKASSYGPLIPWLGTGLLISTGKKWHTRRKQLTPAFHFKILENFQEVFNDQAAVLVDILKEKSNRGEVCEMHSFFTRCALDIICETAMGHNLNCQRDLNHPYAVATLKESEFVWVRWTSPWLHPDFIWSLSPTGREEAANRKILQDFTKKVIRERKRDFLASYKPDSKTSPESDDSVFLSAKKKFAFLDLLLNIQARDGSQQLSDEDIREETDTFMFEGHDTTAAALTWTLYLLAKNPEHQSAVQAELASVFGDDRDRSVTPQDLTQLKFLECCIKEGLRLYPSVPFFQRNITKDFQLDETTVVPAGTDVTIAPWLTHRNPEIFPEPNEFRPSRFAPENNVGRHPYAYIPFSAGPRNCIGQKFALAEEKVLLAHVLRNFKVSVTSSKVTPLPELIVRPKDGIDFKLTPL